MTKCGSLNGVSCVQTHQIKKSCCNCCTVKYLLQGSGTDPAEQKLQRVSFISLSERGRCRIVSLYENIIYIDKSIFLNAWKYVQFYFKLFDFARRFYFIEDISENSHMALGVYFETLSECIIIEKLFILF